LPDADQDNQAALDRGDRIAFNRNSTASNALKDSPHLSIAQCKLEGMGKIYPVEVIPIHA
jgi:hypothetical protein